MVEKRGYGDAQTVHGSCLTYGHLFCDDVADDLLQPLHRALRVAKISGLLHTCTRANVVRGKENRKHAWFSVHIWVHISGAAYERCLSEAERHMV